MLFLRKFSDKLNLEWAVGPLPLLQRYCPEQYTFGIGICIFVPPKKDRHLCEWTHHYGK